MGSCFTYEEKEKGRKRGKEEERKGGGMEGREKRRQGGKGLKWIPSKRLPQSNEKMPSERSTYS